MNAAMSALRSAIGSDRKYKTTLNKIRDVLKAMEADELSRSEIVEHGTRLVEVIPESVTSLHKTRPRPTLAFCAAAVGWLFEAKLEPTLERRDEGSAKTWEEIIFLGLIEPILSIIESEDQDSSGIGDVMCRAIGRLMRSSWSQSFGRRFARSLALVLLHTCSSPSNKAMLLDPSIFGTGTLSRLIIDAKDYHHLDTLLELSFTMFSSKGGKVTRKAYADSIFGSGYALEKLPDEISNELANIHSVTNGGNSEKHVLDIMRTMSRAGIERPQLFMTKDLSYCGTRFTQTPPSNVIILDHENLCMVFCDKNGESDVFTIGNTAIKSVELIPQDPSRIIVELIVSEPPLISSSREELAIPDGHLPGSPLKMHLSIASSDVLGLKTTLAARGLGAVLKDDNALTRHSSLASIKISNAVFSIPLKNNRNPSNEQAEEMIRKYVNLPSSRDTSPPQSTKHIKSTGRVAQLRPLAPRALVTPAAATRQVAPTESKEPVNTSPSTPPITVSPTLQLSDTVLADASVKTTRSAPTRTKRAATGKSQRAAKFVALAQMDGSELTDVDPEDTPEHSVPQTVMKTPVDDAQILPTPPHTRARARVQETTPVAKTLVPSTPTMNDPSEVSSPPDLLSPSPKPTRKRKLFDGDLFEFPPLDSEHPLKQKKTKVTNAILSSQHIQPRHTAATRAKAKYGTISKRMRVSSPVESIQSADTEAVDFSPPRKAPVAPRGKKREDSSTTDRIVTRMQTRLDKNEEANVSKRQTRANAANAKPKPVNTVDEAGLTQNRGTKLDATIVPEIKAVEISEPPQRRKRGRPPKKKPTQKPTQISEPPRRKVDSIKQPPPQPEPENHDASNKAGSAHADGRTETKLTPDTIDHNITSSVQGSPEGDDLLERLSQAAKKALKHLIVDDQPTTDLPRSPSPVEAPEIEMETPDVDTIDAHALELETRTSKGATYQMRDTTVKPMESANTSPTAESSSARVEKKSSYTNSSIKPTTKLPDSSKDCESKSKEYINATRSLTRTPPSTNTQTDGRNVTAMDTTLNKEPTAIPSVLTNNIVNKMLCQQDKGATSTITRAEACVLVPREHKCLILPKTQIQHQSEIIERIQPDKIRAVTKDTPVAQVETPARDQRRTKLPQVFISVDSTNSDVDIDPSQEFAPRQPILNPTRRPNVLTSRPIPTSRPIVKLQLHEAPTPTKFKHAAVTRVLLDVGTQSSPKSALASPQKRTLPNGTRPSVSFLEPPVHLSRRGYSGSSTEDAQNSGAYRIDREKLREGHSEHSGDTILEIADKLTEIQELIMLNLGEKVQTVNAEARRAHAELTEGVAEELDKMKVESESRHHVLHKFESAFASQAQAMFDGLGRIFDFNDRMNAGIEGIIAANARAGQNVASSGLDFQIPKLFGALFTSSAQGVPAL
ncbi:unnamed protein product [Rhizoctonia solani]|uniref:Uncharacterized protein n=1 Tax=Rhizoctonia solani TaxID=456999 RepID=A0A8H2XXR7_9AGAM|nr:unnamed protein product [Rhizoctonia solani]